MYADLKPTVLFPFVFSQKSAPETFLTIDISNIGRHNDNHIIIARRLTQRSIPRLSPPGLATTFEVKCVDINQRQNSQNLIVETLYVRFIWFSKLRFLRYIAIIECTKPDF